VVAASGAARSYEIATLRELVAGRARSAFRLDEPAALRGTAFLLEERLADGARDFRVWLYLPSGAHRVFEVRGATLSQPLLGSDFSYQDWRLWLPLADLEAVRLPDLAADERALLAVEARPRTEEAAAALGWERARLAVDPDTWAVARAEYFGPRRSFRAEGWTAIDGVSIPRRMVMARPESGERTVVELIEAWHDRAIPPAALLPESLPDLGRWLAVASGSGPSAQPPEPGPGSSPAAGSRPGR
jgi:hypothetical protein